MLDPEVVKHFSKVDFRQHLRTPFWYKIGNDNIHNQVGETTIIKSAWIASLCYLVTKCIQSRSIKAIFSPSLVVAIGVGASTLYYNAFVARCRTLLTVTKLQNNFENDLKPKDLLLSLRNCWKENATMCLITAFNLYAEKQSQHFSALSGHNKPVIIDFDVEQLNPPTETDEIIIVVPKKPFSSFSVLIATLIILNKKSKNKSCLDLTEFNFISKIHDPKFLVLLSDSSKELFKEAQKNLTGFDNAVTQLVASNS